MKLDTFRTLRAHSIFITIFFIGVVWSCGKLFFLLRPTASEELLVAAALVVSTFLAGIIAVSLVARAGKSKIIYLERRHENALTENQAESTIAALTNADALRKFHSSPQLWLNNLCEMVEAAQGALYVADKTSVHLQFGYALPKQNNEILSFEFGQGLIGRVAKEGTTLRIEPLPDGYITVFSGLGAASPRHLVIVPIKSGDHVTGVLELATFTTVDEAAMAQIEKACSEMTAHLILSIIHDHAAQR